MKILLTGGVTGGHFYPIIAVANELNEIARENRLLKPELFFMSIDPYNENLLYENNITFKQISAGKIRRAFSIPNLFANFFDLFKTGIGVLSALWNVFTIYPDVVFGKGGYASFPALLAARILRIPVVIHESDSLPGRVNSWAGKFAARIAISYPDVAKYFPTGKTAYTGNPVRKEIMDPLSVGAHEFLHLDPSVPTIFILGGSQGSRPINEIILDALPELVKRCQIIHQVGKKNIAVIQETCKIVLSQSEFKDRYKPFDYLNLLAMRMSAGAADLIISRAGSTIFEIACWKKPSIIIPIPESTSHDQRTNAYSYARTGAAEVIEEKNLASHVLISEVFRLLDSPTDREKMSEAAGHFARRDASKLIAEEIMTIALEHDK